LYALQSKSVVGVIVGVFVAVEVGAVGVGDGGLVAVGVGVIVRVGVLVGVSVIVGVLVGSGVLVGVDDCVGVGLYPTYSPESTDPDCTMSFSAPIGFQMLDCSWGSCQKVKPQ